MIRFKSRKRVEVISIIFVFVVSWAIAFFHVHWIAYGLEAHHVDYAGVVPPALVIIADVILLIIISIIKKKTNKQYDFLIVVLLIVLMCSIYAFVFSHNACCPACNEVHDKWYLFFHKLIKGRPYEPI